MKHKNKKKGNASQGQKRRKSQNNARKADPSKLTDTLLILPDTLKDLAVKFRWSKRYYNSFEALYATLAILNTRLARADRDDEKKLPLLWWVATVFMVVLIYVVPTYWPWCLKTFKALILLKLEARESLRLPDDSDDQFAVVEAKFDWEWLCTKSKRALEEVWSGQSVIQALNAFTTSDNWRHGHASLLKQYQWYCESIWECSCVTVALILQSVLFVVVLKFPGLSKGWWEVGAVQVAVIYIQKLFQSLKSTPAHFEKLQRYLPASLGCSVHLSLDTIAYATSSATAYDTKAQQRTQQAQVFPVQGATVPQPSPSPVSSTRPAPDPDSKDKLFYSRYLLPGESVESVPGDRKSSDIHRRDETKQPTA